eukprot:GFYU01002608.1.p1 GENE.GFYU01002608.1~~GFYU01002608.1.p1  ORF type:complete len:623 (-),score=179.29 GFYU01002608.1:368-2134(-)
MSTSLANAFRTAGRTLGRGHVSTAGRIVPRPNTTSYLQRRGITTSKKNVAYTPTYTHSTSAATATAATASSNARLLMMAAAGTLGSLTYYAASKRSRADCDAAVEGVPIKAGEEKRGLPTYRRADVAKHNCKENRIWITYKDGVYDITDFVEAHPGGERILMAAGGAIDPFWAMYAAHQTEHTYELLEQYRIGNYSKEDRKAAAASDDPYGNEPERHPALKLNSAKPFNAETPSTFLAENYHTPNALFFVRNHLPAPDIKEKDYVLEIEGPGMKGMKLSLQDLRTKFKHYSVSSVVQCAGNRRFEMSEQKKVKGLGWDTGAISNAEWTGVRLRDVLLYAGLDEENLGELRHCQFEGYDRDATAPYGSSIPLRKAIDRYGDCILAFKMNGEPIPRDHGYPVRVIVPGVVGARNVKWLAKVSVAKEESPSFWQQKDYKTFPPNLNWDNVTDKEFQKAESIQELPVTSAVTEPKPRTAVTVEDGKMVVKGYAYSGGGRGIARVDVSCDGGQTWQVANLNKGPKTVESGREWGWSLWSAEIQVPTGLKEVEVICKATDGSANVQPEEMMPIWNLRGLLNNAWHRAKYTVKHE